MLYTYCGCSSNIIEISSSTSSSYQKEMHPLTFEHLLKKSSISISLMPKHLQMPGYEASTQCQISVFRDNVILCVSRD